MSSEEMRRKQPTTTIVWARQGVIVAMKDAELGGRVCELARSGGMDATFADGVPAALEAWNDQTGVVIVDAGFGRKAVPLVERAVEADAAALVVGGISDGEWTLRLLEAGARTYLPLPQSPEKITHRLHEFIAREAELRGESGLIELAKSELQAVFDTFPSPLVVVGPDVRIRRANRAALLLSRRSSFKDILGRTPYEVFRWPEEDDCPVKQGIATRRDVEGEFEVVPDTLIGVMPRVFRCRVFASSRAGLDDGALVLLEDVTMSTREESERARREKLEAVALLAATLSHEINQPLGTILGRAQLAQLGLDQPDTKGTDLRRDLKDIVECVERISNILEKLHEVTDIVTKTYPGGARILDLDRSVGPPPPGGQALV